MIHALLTSFAYDKVDTGCIKEFLMLPHWYKYLEVRESSSCAPQINQLNDFWLIGLALIEILTRIAVFVAIAYIIYAGVKYSESRGNVDKAAAAKNTLIDAIAGLIIAMVATAIVSFLGGQFS